MQAMDLVGPTPYSMCYAQDSLGIRVEWPDGRRDIHCPESNFNGEVPDSRFSSGEYVAPVGIFDALTQFDSDKYVLRTKEGMQYFFEDPSHKKITRIVDRNGNAISLTYSGGELREISDPSGRKVELNWAGGSLRNISHSLVGSPRTYEYSYNSEGDLIGVKNALGDELSYQYDANHNLTQYTDENDQIYSIEYNEAQAVSKLLSCFTQQLITYNSNSRTTYLKELVGSQEQLTVYKYDEQGRLFEQQGNCCGYRMQYVYDGANNISQTIDANGNAYQYAYDKRGNLVAETDPLRNTKTYEYEPTFNQLSRLTDKNGQSYTYVYDNRGNLVEERLPLGIVLTSTYDEFGNLLSFTNGLENSTNYTYDPQGYLLTELDPEGAEISYAYDGVGNITSIVDANGNTTEFEYDLEDRMLKITDALGNLTQFTYDAKGNRLSETDPNNHTTEFTYDELDRLVSRKDPLGNLTQYEYDPQNNLVTLVDANGHTYQFEYDALNRLTQTINPLFEATFFEYDGNGNLIAMILPNGNHVMYEYDAFDRLVNLSDNLGELRSFGYDNNSNLLIETDGEGNATRYTYDELNRLVSLIDPLGNEATYTYDREDNVLRAVDRKGRNTNFLYDKNNRLLSVTDAQGDVSSYSYDPVGNLIRITDANSNSTSYQFDVLNRMVQETYADGTTRAFNYDGVGNRISLKNNNDALIGYAYDAANRLIEKTFPDGTMSTFGYDRIGNLIEAINPTAEVNFSFDAANRLIEENLNGRSTRTQYDVFSSTRALHYPGGKTIKEEMDPRGQLLRVSEGRETIASYSYDLAERRTEAQFHNGTSSTYQYDANSRLIGLSHLPTQNQMARFTVAYDEEDNVVAENWLHRPTRSESYTYDPLDRITEFKRGTLSGNTIPSPLRGIGLEYDGLGNRISYTADGVKTDYVANGVNAYASLSGAIATNPTYDRNGNLTSYKEDRFTYDDENRLISINGGETATYLYDAIGRRIGKLVQEDTTYFYYDRVKVIEEVEANGVLEATYIYGSDMDEVICMERGEETYYYHYNATGSVIQLTGSEGELVEQYEYDPYGKVTIYDGSYTSLVGSAVGNPYLFTGRRLDSESGLYFYRSRYFSAELGRFLQRDPLGYVDGLSMYEYVLSNPKNWKDPLGLNADPCENNDSFWDDALSFGGEIMDFLNPLNHFQSSFNAYQNGNYLEAIGYGLIGTGQTILYGVALVKGAAVLGTSFAITNGIRFLAGRIGVRSALSSLRPLANRVISSSNRPGSVYDGVRAASRYLKKMGVQRNERKQILESFDVRTMSVRKAGDNVYGLRFWDGRNAKEVGRYLFDTFTNTTNRVGLALPPWFNSMSRISQFKLRPGTTFLYGRAASQGGRFTGGNYQMYVRNLKNLQKLK